MRRPRSRNLRLPAAWALSLTFLGLPHPSLVAPGVAANFRDLLPDLRMVAPREIRLQVATTEEGPDRRLLPFTAIIINRGEGPFVVRAKRDCATSACPTMTTRQRIKRSDGSWRAIDSTATAEQDVGDGHRHWHVLNVERYELYQLDPPATEPTPVRGVKVGFCFFDGVAWNLSLKGAPSRRVYLESGCGTTSSTSLKRGLSVGWGDVYAWSISRQWIDTTGLPAGRYLLCSTANASGVARDEHYEQRFVGRRRAVPEL